jgi:hypothetical protein
MDRSAFRPDASAEEGGSIQVIACIFVVSVGAIHAVSAEESAKANTGVSRV